MQPKYIIAGDVGGTKTILGLAVFCGGGFAFRGKRLFESGRYCSLEDMIEEFIEGVQADAGDAVASLGIAGAVRDGKCRTTNLPWEVDEDALRKRFGFMDARLMNDFKATACGIPYLKEADIAVLNEGRRDDKGPVAIIGAGTGLGEGFAFFSKASNGYHVIPSEGGHSSFSPTNEEEIALLKYLLAEYGHVSFERVLSGQGLYNIYSYLADSGFAERNPEVTAMLSSGDRAAVISRFGLSGKDSLCSRALDIFTGIYGAEAGNLALKFLPSGGLYVGGGMAPKIMEKMKEGTFMGAFLNKGRLSSFLKDIPVYVILNEEAGLIGAAAIGNKQVSQ